MDHHHKMIGFIFAYTATNLINWGSMLIFERNNRSDLRRIDEDKTFYWCAVSYTILGLIQLITSALLTIKEKFLKPWLYLHIFIGLAYAVIFTIQILSDRVDKNYYISYDKYNYNCAQNFLLLIPISLLTLKRYKSEN